MDIRLETQADLAAIHALNCAAFGQPMEADLVDRLRAEGDAVLSLVAVEHGEIVGHILFSRMEAPFRALALTPVAVLPPRQRKAIGAALIREGLARAEAAGWQGVFVLGEPAYYRRFGFSAEQAVGFASPYAGPYFMALPLGDALPASSGEIAHAPAFAALG
jgi:putative acetyltransferase